MKVSSLVQNFSKKKLNLIFHYFFITKCLVKGGGLVTQKIVRSFNNGVEITQWVGVERKFVSRNLQRFIKWGDRPNYSYLSNLG